MVAGLVLLWASTAGAQSRYRKLCDKDDPKQCAQAVAEGELVPFDGQLYTIKKAVQQSQKANWCDERTKAAVEHVKERGQEKLDNQLTICAIDARGFQQQIDLLMLDNKELRAAAAVPWYREPPFVAAVTVVITTAVFWGVAEMQQAVAR